MIKHICLFFSLLLLASCSSYISVAPSDPVSAKGAIEEIKDQGLVILWPTEYTKEKALKERATYPHYAQQLEKLQAKRDTLYNIWQESKAAYNFSDIHIIPDSLLSQWIDGQLPNLPQHHIYARYLQYGGFEIKKAYDYIAAPFPSKISASRMARLRDLFGVQSEQKSSDYFFEQLDQKLKSYYMKSQLQMGN